MNIVFMGTPDFAVPTLTKLINSKHTVKAVFTQTDKPKGRGHKLTPPPIKVLATENGIDVYQPKSIKNNIEENLNIIKDIDPDIIVVVAYGKILPKEVLDLPKYGCVNVHGSILPKYRGSGPIQWAVLNDEKETGITTMQMGEGIDTGDILLIKKTPIGENETAAELFDRLSLIGADLLLETLEKLEKNEIIPIPQNNEKSTHAPMLTKDMCPIDFNCSVRKVHKQICGLSDWPCATAILNQKRLKIYKSEIVATENKSYKCGEVVDNKNFDVACSNGIVRLLEVQADGSKRMNAKDYLRGRPIDKGTILE